ncbi:hypothetical protein L208DRAFT_1410311 [Tricholoma matsutake]|nr:hypothetical protein L208DRAFT_1410311 [Tricholoma matsutake 945]
MPPKPRGHPPKKRRNLTGLQNNSSLSVAPLATSNSQACHNVRIIGLGDAATARSEGSVMKDQASSEAEDSDSEGEEMDAEDYAESDWDELEDQEFAERLVVMALEDNPNDLDWVPAKVRIRQTATKKARPATYAKGPENFQGCKGSSPALP